MADIIKKIKRIPYINFRHGFNGSTLLHIYATDLGVVALLLLARADPNAKDMYQETPLHKNLKHGSWFERREAMRLLTDFEECDVKAQNVDGDTPLHLGLKCQDGHEDLPLLINHPRIDLNIRNNAKKTPLTIALENHVSEEIITLLRERGATE